MKFALHCFKDMVPSSEACLYGCINWSLAQIQPHSSLGSSQSITSYVRWKKPDQRLGFITVCKRDGKARPKTGFHYSIHKRPLLESSGASVAKKPHLESKTEDHQGGRKLTGGSVSASSSDSRKKGSHGGQHS